MKKMSKQTTWLVTIVLFLVTLSAVRAATITDASPLRIGLTPVFLDDRVSFLRKWSRYLEAKLDRPVKFVQRRTYRQITDLLVEEKLDAAWICGYPYVRNTTQFNLLAVPLYLGEPVYQSYLIVPSTDKETKAISDLKGKVFAYSDPDSNSGFLAPQVALRRSGFDPDTHFSKTFFAWAHRDVVSAVAKGVAQGGAVDGYVWDMIAKLEPELAARTRVVRKSEEFGFPPFVTRASLSDEEFKILQSVLVEMAADQAGRELLESLNLDGFTPGNDELFSSIRAAMRVMPPKGEKEK